jgi:hypothetical protein
MPEECSNSQFQTNNSSTKKIHQIIPNLMDFSLLSSGWPVMLCFADPAKGRQKTVGRGGRGKSALRKEGLYPLTGPLKRSSGVLSFFVG